ncbi:SPRY domain-containing SOCS box protein 3 [Orchesella cincta]|uniref:SPRY domain-containing SOCS box protein 3 n=1 Tax=Orchesella cincta TaxID=48709 RepID=A0A1D2NH17_ORCCI|nr:SPRY domain-containing SOCS box protein 3 [Orchesella cincta]
MPSQPVRKLAGCVGCRPLARGKICEECQRRVCFEWNWEKDGTGSTVVFHNNDRDVIFNPGFSVGTVAVRGTQPFKPGCHHYWEIEMSTEVYGTDMMIGVGTDKTDLKKFTHNFVSLIGNDENSWGLSYLGQKKHAGQSHQYAKQFGQHSVIGVHLDLWAGKLEFYVDRKPLGVAFEGLQDKGALYPIISSTAARSGMNLIFCRSYSSSLQLQAMLSLSRNLPSSIDNVSLFEVLPIPPGLKLWMKNHYWWIVSCPDRDRKREEDLNNRSKRENRNKFPGSEYRANKTPPQGESKDEQTDDSGNEVSDDGGVFDLSGGSEEGLAKEPDRCTHSDSGESSKCFRLLAAASSRAQFLGRVSPIFVGLPEGGFSVSSSSSRPVTRSRSVPAQPSTSSSGVGGSGSRILREPVAAPSSSDDEDAPQSSRREAKRLRLRESIDIEGEDSEEKRLQNGNDKTP